MDKRLGITITVDATQANTNIAAFQSNMIRMLAMSGTGLQGVTAKATSFIQGAFQKTGSVVGGVFNTMMGGANKWASFFGGMIILGIGKNLVDMAAQFERFGKAAEFMTGSRAEADKFAQSVRNIAKETMFNVDQIAEMESRLVGNTRNVKLSDTALRALTEAVAATGGKYTELEGATRAWIQVNSKAKVSSEELNRQFANANIPIVRLLAESISKDLNHPLRQYIAAAGSGGAGGASKKLTTAFGKVNETIKWTEAELVNSKKKLEEWTASGKHSESSMNNLRLTIQKKEAALSKANSTIGEYTAAQAKMTTGVKAGKLSVEEIMAQLQEVGDLNIPGTIGAAAITRALNEAYGGANKELIKTFDGQMSLLGDTLKLTALGFVGLDKNFRVVKGGFLDLLKSGLIPLLTFLNTHQDDFVKFAQGFHKNLPMIMAVATFILGILMPAIIGLVGPILLTAALWAAFGYALGLVIEKLGGMDKIMSVVKPKIEGLFNFIKQNAEPIKALLLGLATAISVVLVAAFISWAISAGMAAIFTLIALAPIIIVMAAITAAVALLKLAWDNNWGGIQEKVRTVIDWFNGTALPILQVAFELIKQSVQIAMDLFKEKFDTAKRAVEELKNFIEGTFLPNYKKAMDEMGKVLDVMMPGWVKQIGTVASAFGGVAREIGNILGKIDELVRKASGKGLQGNITQAMLKMIPGVGMFFQHGGIVPGMVGQPVPIIAHGGERIIPRGSNTNAPSGGGGGVTINMTGPVSLDSPQRVKELADTIIRIMGRQSELAKYGMNVSFV